jgi:hypothetical protein
MSPQFFMRSKREKSGETVTLTSQNLGFKSYRCRERRGHEAGLLALFENAKRTVFVRTCGEAQTRPKHSRSYRYQCPVSA